MNCINLILVFLLPLTSVFGTNDFYFITTPNILITETPHVFKIQTSTDLIISIETVHPPSQIKHQSEVYVVAKGFDSMPYYVPFAGSHVGSKIQVNFKGDICMNLKECESTKVVVGSFINKTYELGLIDKNFIIFAETDKPIYKPGEKVKLRFMPIYPTNLMREPDSVGKRLEIILNSDGKYTSNEYNDKKKSQEFDLIFIENPDGVRVAQWRNVNIDQSMNLEYQLTKDPVLGVWKSKAVYEGQEEVSEFTVKKYVLPRFVVEVSPPDEILANDEEIKFKVCSKYSTGKTMEAQIHGTFCLIFNQNENKCQTFQSELRKVDCVKISLKNNMAAILKGNTYRYYKSKSVVNVTVTENGTSSSVSKVAEGSGIKFTPYEIKFESNPYFKPGLPYFGKVKLERHNKKPQVKTIVQISVSGDYRNKWGFNRNYTSGEFGLIEFIIPFIPVEDSITIQIKGDENHIKTPMRNPNHYQRLSNWASVDKQYLQIQPNDNALKCPGNLDLKILTNHDVSTIDMFVQVFSRGQITDMNMFPSVPTKCQSRDDFVGHYTCNNDNTITCRQGYKGDNCREPICEGGCINGACVEPNKCVCKIGWDGNSCDQCIIAPRCQNGYCKYGNDCECYPGWRDYDCSRKGPKIHYYNPEPITPISSEKPSVIKKYENQTIFERMIKIPLLKHMGPDVHLVVYFINGNNEVVADAIEITSGLENCSHVGGKQFSFDKTSTIPKSKVVLTMDPGTINSSCAVRIGDLALSQFGKSGNVDLDSLVRKLIDLNHKITVGSRFGINNERSCIPSGRMKRRIWQGNNYGFESRKAFSTAGFTTITNARIINSQCRPSLKLRGIMKSSRINSLSLKKSVPISEDAADNNNEKLKLKQQIREYFPESWLFSYFNQTPKKLDLIAPDSMTTWKANCYCMTEKGIWIAPSETLKVVLPFFTDVYVPYSMKLDEQLHLPVKIFNYAEACYEIRVEINVHVSEIKVIGVKSFNLCVCANDEKAVYFDIQPQIIGKLNVTIDAVSKYSDSCSKKGEKKQEIEMNDSIRRQLNVEPPGVPTDTTFSELICNKNEQFGIVELFTIPTNIVNGSLRSYLTFNGDVMGQTFDNLDKLVKMPYGCGEQNMVALVPSIYVLQYLNGLKIENPVLSGKAKQYIIEGYTRQMTYKHDDGSFSAFGKWDKSGSTWLTSFVLRSFSDASKFVEFDRIILKEALKYLEKMQLTNGCFKEQGKLFSSSMAGGVENTGGTDESLLTAYVLISLKNVDTSNSTFNINKAVSCVESALATNSSNYQLVLTAYVLSLYGKNQQSITSVMEQLLRRSVKSGRYQYWRYNKDGKDNSKVNAADVETTGYAFLALQNHQSPSESLKTVYWLSNQRNSIGGYHSTQDTVVALNALSVFAEKIGLSGNVNLNVSITVNRERTYSDSITEDNRLLSRNHNLESENISYISIKTNGTGCVSIQLVSLYNIDKLYTATDVFKLSVRSSIPSDEQCNYRNVKVCFSYLRRDKNSNMILVTIDYPSGWELPNNEIDNLKRKMFTPLNRIDFQNTKMELYYDAFSYNDAGKEYCFQFQLEEKSKISNIKPALARIIDYYNPELYTDASYSVFDKSCDEISKLSESSKPLSCPKCLSNSNEGSVEFVRLICSSRLSGVVSASNNINNNQNRTFYQSEHSSYYEWEVDVEPRNCSCINEWPHIKRQFVVLSKRWQSLEEKLVLSNESVMIPLESVYSAFTYDLRNQCSKANNFYKMMNRLIVDFSKRTQQNNYCPTCILRSDYHFTIKNVTEWYCSNNTYWNLNVTSVSPTVKGVLTRNDSVVNVEIKFPNKLCYCQDQLNDEKKTFRIADLKNKITNVDNKEKKEEILLLNSEFQIVEEIVFQYNNYITC